MPRLRAWPDGCLSAAGATAARPRSDPPRQVEPPAAKDRVTQTPGVRVFGVGDPALNTPPHFVFGHRAVPPAVAQTAEAVAEAADVLLGQPPAAAGKEDEADTAAGGMVNHPVPKGGRGNHAVLRIADLDLRVASRTIEASVQLPLEPQDLGLEVGKKSGDARGSRAARSAAACSASKEAMRSNRSGAATSGVRFFPRRRPSAPSHRWNARHTRSDAGQVRGRSQARQNRKRSFSSPRLALAAAR